MNTLSMLLKTVLIIVLISAASVASWVEQYDNSSVLNGTENFDMLREAYPYLLVHFLAPWGGYDKSAQPAIMNASVMLRDQYPDVYSRARFAFVNCFPNDSHYRSPLCEKEDVSGHSTFKYYSPVRSFHYYGERTVEDFVRFFVHYVPSQPTLITTQSDSKALPDTMSQYNLTDVMVLGIYEDINDVSSISPFINASIKVNVTDHIIGRYGRYIPNKSIRSTYRFALASNSSLFEGFQFPTPSLTIFTANSSPTTYTDSRYLVDSDEMVKLIIEQGSWAQGHVERQTVCSDPVVAEAMYPSFSHEKECINPHPGQDFTRHITSDDHTVHSDEL